MNYKELIEGVGLVLGLTIGLGVIAHIALDKEEGWGNALAIIWVPMIFVIIFLIAFSSGGR